MRKTSIQCPICGVIAYRFPSQMPKSIENYKCRKCWSTYRARYEPCPVCEKPVRRTLSRIEHGTRRYCTRGWFMKATKESRIKNLMRGDKPEYLRKLFSERLKRLWLDPKFVKKITEGRIRKPNKLEIYVTSILEKYHLPFAYNGNFELGITIGGMIPDFVNIDGKKQVIEVFGDAFHDANNTHLRISYKRTEKGRTELYRALGFDTLILWEKDIRAKNEEELGDILSQFCTREVT